MGIDGWIYIAVGDYGIVEAKGKDGAKVTLRGGGILRVRPDGTELEIFCTGIRNPFDIAIDPHSGWVASRKKCKNRRLTSRARSGPIASR
jgi:predicted RNase H-like HicB family nuclease